MCLGSDLINVFKMIEVEVVESTRECFVKFKPPVYGLCLEVLLQMKGAGM